jgi:phage terminase large subunit-like protein
MFDILEGSGAARKQPLNVYITTAGKNTAGIGFETHAYYLDVVNQVRQDDTAFACIYDLDQGDDPLSESVWIKANPNLGVSVDLDNMRSQAARAKFSASALNNFKTKRLNFWGLGDEQWMDPQKFNVQATNISLSDFEGEQCHIAIDLSSRLDLTAANVTFVRDGAYYAITRYWLPEEALENNANESVYKDWAEAGHLIIVDGERQDYTLILGFVEEVFENHDVRSIALDEWQSGWLIKELEKGGLGSFTVGFGQTTKNYTGPMKDLESEVTRGNYYHDGNPCTSWCFSNVRTRTDQNDNIFPRKAAPARRIDGAVVGIMSFSRWQVDNDLGEGSNSGVSVC